MTSEPMTRREKVARAIEAVDPDGPLRFNGEPDFSDFDEWDREKYLRMGDAAIEALRPDAEAFTAALDDLLYQARHNRYGDEVDAARREVERLAGIGEDAG